MKINRLCAAALLPALLVACDFERPVSGDRPLLGEVPTELVATVLVPSANAGAAIEVEFQNPTDASYYLSICSRTVQRRSGGEWHSLPDEMRLCTADVQYIPARGAVRYTVDVSTDASPGAHRFAWGLQMEHAPGWTGSLYSTSFEVR